eukprot:gnl/TRDRNA2_/TRDRNA2_75251_c0_seq1.p1 gnl/TRDRNA2_/TRDRNA2_75251_c0~~gnl/TRDRNA2_/TRDRNA2_75251_c0_seq1.p1  ORF type:complete len:379 (-),score=43.89 gnl/TRDRNA2_/TRDRNA2_75251_c0_seq1:18-1154(-)
MRWRLVGLLVKVATAAEDASCWTEGFDYNKCCYARDPTCWDATYSYERCCAGRLGPFAKQSTLPRLMSRLMAKGHWDRTAINIGAGDGVSMISGESPGLSCAGTAAHCDEVYGDPLYPLYAHRGFRGLAVEAAEKYRDALRGNLPTNVTVRISEVNPVNVLDLLANARVQGPEFDVLKIDIDSHDCEILLAILDAGFRPKVIQMEVNVEIPLPLIFSVMVSERFNEQAVLSGLFGCSLALVASLADRFGYVMAQVGLTHDVTLVRREIAARAHVKPLEAEEAMAQLERCCMTTHIGSVLWDTPAFDVWYSSSFRASDFPTDQKFALAQSTLAAGCAASEPDGNCHTNYLLSTSLDQFLKVARETRAAAAVRHTLSTAA